MRTEVTIPVKSSFILRLSFRENGQTVTLGRAFLKATDNLHENYLKSSGERVDYNLTFSIAKDDVKKLLDQLDKE